MWCLPVARRHRSPTPPLIPGPAGPILLTACQFNRAPTSGVVVARPNLLTACQFNPRACSSGVRGETQPGRAAWSGLSEFTDSVSVYSRPRPGQSRQPLPPADVLPACSALPWSSSANSAPMPPLPLPLWFRSRGSKPGPEELQRQFRPDVPLSPGTSPDAGSRPWRRSACFIAASDTRIMGYGERRKIRHSCFAGARVPWLVGPWAGRPDRDCR